MARIVITTLGSSGDLNPFLALGIGLRQRGHDVLFAVEDSFRPAVTGAGFAVHHLTGDAESALAPYARQMFGKMTPIPSVKYIAEQYIVPTLRPKIEELREACKGADLLVSAFIQLAASAVADLTGIPWASVALTPVIIPSIYVEPQPTPIPVPGSLQPLANRLSWALGSAMVRHLMDGPVNRVRAEYRLPPRRDLLWTGNLSDTLTAVSVSPAFFSRPPDWPASVRVTGFCFWDTPLSWQEPPELSAFLDGSKPVIAVSSGSMAPAIRDVFAHFYRTGVAAIRGLGARALVIGAAPDILPDPLPADVLALPFAPFSQVYPRCAAVIHHGGIGTTAQGLRAGVPALVVPWGADQIFNGAQITRIGAGRWMQRRFYTHDRAIRALDALLHDPAYKAHARAIAARIAQEDGVTAICDDLEEVLRRPATPSMAPGTY